MYWLVNGGGYTARKARGMWYVRSIMKQFLCYHGLEISMNVKKISKYRFCGEEVARKDAISDTDVEMRA
jgi:hypothetical protein